MTTASIILGTVATLGGLGLGALRARYLRDARAGIARVSTGSRIVETTRGPIEVAERGEGVPVLVVHGGAGGFDQGLMTAQVYLDERARVLAPSRFGHLRTALPPDASAATQADAFVALLDALGIERAAVFGTSGGGPSSLQLALRHPRRCAALVLSAAVTMRLPARSTGVYRTDFGYWLATTLLRAVARRKIGVSRRQWGSCSAQERAWLDALLAGTTPLGPRRAGLLHDIAEWADAERWAHDYPLEDIVTPTLVIHALDDAVVPFAHAEHAARRIPSARLCSLTSGGHIRLGHRAALRRLIGDFIVEHSGAAESA